VITCGQTDCERPAEARTFWPGHEPAAVCAYHLRKARAVASAMGFYLHTEPIFPSMEELHG
jgi:hypothetical protein